MSFLPFALPLSVLLSVGVVSGLGAADHVVYAGGEGGGKGKHVVLLAGDEEYRSEESLPMLGQILSKHHGFKSTVCFSLNEAVSGGVGSGGACDRTPDEHACFQSAEGGSVGEVGVE
jgi:hypothetical protein